MKIRCPHCRRYFGAPDMESVRTYAASGGIIQTLTERIVVQPIIKRYETPTPVMRAVALVLPLVFFAPGLTLYFNVNPLVSGAILVTSASILFVAVSTRVEEREIDDEPNEDEDEGDEPDVGQAPGRLEEITRPGPNSISIRLVHEPPHNPDPGRQSSLGRADFELARLATGPNPISPISFAAARQRGYKAGEPTFYQVQRHWIERGLAFRANTGAVYLRESGRRILAKYAQQ